MPKRFLEFLGSQKLFFVLLSYVLVLCVLGGVIPQNAPLEKYHELFGSLFGGGLLALRLNDLFRSPLFTWGLTLTAINFTACTFVRWEKSKKRPAVIVSHLAMLLLFAGGALRGITSQSGILPLRIGQDRASFDRDDGTASPLPFSVRLKDFHVDYWNPDSHLLSVDNMAGDLREEAAIEIGKPISFPKAGVTVTPVRFYPHFVMGENGPSSLDDSPENPAVELRVTDKGKEHRRFVFARFGDIHADRADSDVRFSYAFQAGRIKQFESLLSFEENGREVAVKTVRVNTPAAWRGFRFFQSGYDPKDPEFSTLQVSKDPTVWLVYLGFLVLTVGVAWSFLQRREFEL